MNAQPTIVNTALGPVEVAECGEGPAVLALHGTMGGWNQSMSLVRTIGAPGFRYLALSRPGYLGTPLQVGKSPATQADLCAALLDALGIADAGVIGLSGGGPIALQFAQRHSSRTWGLLLVSTCAGKTMTPTPPAVFALAAHLSRWSWLSKKLQARMANNLHGPATQLINNTEVLDRTLAHSEVGPLLTEFVLGMFERMYQRVDGTYNDIEIMRTTDHALAQITAPTLVVHGTADQMLSYADNAKVFAARIPNAQLLTIEGGEHGAIFSHRDQIRTAVDAFLNHNAPGDACA